MLWCMLNKLILFTCVFYKSIITLNVLAKVNLPVVYKCDAWDR